MFSTISHVAQNGGKQIFCTIMGLRLRAGGGGGDGFFFWGCGRGGGDIWEGNLFSCPICLPISLG